MLTPLLQCLKFGGLRKVLHNIKLAARVRIFFSIDLSNSVGLIQKKMRARVLASNLFLYMGKMKTGDVIGRAKRGF